MVLNEESDELFLSDRPEHPKELTSPGQARIPRLPRQNLQGSVLTFQSSACKGHIPRK